MCTKTASTESPEAKQNTLFIGRIASPSDMQKLFESAHTTLEWKKRSFGSSANFPMQIRALPVVIKENSPLVRANSRVRSQL
jgi:hypothetical protein